MDGVLLIQVIIILLIIGVIIYLLRLYRGVRLEKRLAPFAIDTTRLDDPVLLETINKFINIIVSKITLLVKKSASLTKYSTRYNKYISFEEKDKKDGTYFVSLKLFISLTILILSFVSAVFQTLKLDFMLVLIILIISFYIPDIYLYIIDRRKRKRIEEDLLKAIIIMNNAFSSGKNIMQATCIVKDTLEGPIEEEFKKIYLDITYGLDLDVVFNRFYERVKLEDIKYITTSLSLLNKTGGDIIKVFSLIEKSIFEKKNLKNELYSLTASSRFVWKFLIVLPIIFSLIIFILNPTYFKPLFTSSLGLMVLAIILILYILYIYIIRKIFEVKI